MTTDLPVLEQACRNTRDFWWFRYNAGHAFFGGTVVDDWKTVVCQDGIAAEYKYLLRLKKSKKRWKS